MALLASGSELGKGEPTVIAQNDVEKTQQILQDKGHYRGKVDGVFGLRTRASIRAFQKAERLPVTGQLDPQTAGKLGVKPEAIRADSHEPPQEIGQGRNETSQETTKGKPSAGIQLSKGSRRSSKTQPKAVKPVSETEFGRRNHEKKLQAENDPR